MKKWFYQQLLEITAWFGLLLIISSFFTLPSSVYFVAGVLLIAIDDQKAGDFLKRIAPGIQRKIDGIKKP